MNRPLISVIILNFRRPTELARALESVRAQAYEPRELLVVDNASGDGSVNFVAQSFPEARVIALPENIGCGGRNRGVQAAQGSFVVTIDNDIRFNSPFELGKIVDAFERKPEASALAFKILRDATGRLHLRDWCHPRSFHEYANVEFETCYIPEGACAFRRDDFLRTGGYYEPFRIGGEGDDLAYRMIDAGLRIFYCPQVEVRHSMSEETRAGRRPHYYYMRNHIWTAFRNYSGWRRWKFLTYSFALVGFFALRTGNLRELYCGARDGLRGLSQIGPALLSEAGWRRLEEINSHRPSWLTRLKTHWKQEDL